MSTTSLHVAAHAVTDALRAISGPIFAATWSERRGAKALTVHVSSTGGRRQLKAVIAHALSNIGIEGAHVKFHAPAALMSPRSLEALVAKLGAEEIAYDPTQSLARAKALVETSSAVRSSLGERVRGLFYAPLLRTYYVVLEPSRVIAGDKVKVAELAAIERAVGTAILHYFGSLESPAVRVGFGVPATSLVAVDQGSVVGGKESGLARLIRRYWKPVTVAALFGLGAGAARADAPAVEAPNLKVSGQFGEVIDDYAWNVQGQFTAPLGERFGFAAEAGIGAVNGQEAYGVGGHLFARNPDSYLLGVFGGYAEAANFDVDLARVGAEAEIYLSAVTLTAKAGYQFSSALGDGAFGGIDLRWYLTNNFYLSAGGEFEKDRNSVTAGAEWQPGFAALPGLAFNARGVWGDDDYQSVMGGLTYYFGADASLKDRHRKYDPDSALLSLFQKVQQEQQRLCTQYGC
jgi:phage shock protein PspC (stress-responsive transcriptional regulator)